MAWLKSLCKTDFQFCVCPIFDAFRCIQYSVVHITLLEKHEYLLLGKYRNIFYHAYIYIYIYIHTLYLPDSYSNPPDPRLPLSLSLPPPTYLFYNSGPHALLEKKLKKAGTPRYYKNQFLILRELVHDFPIFAYYYVLIRVVYPRYTFPFISNSVHGVETLFLLAIFLRVGLWDVGGYMWNVQGVSGVYIYVCVCQGGGVWVRVKPESLFGSSSISQLCRIYLKKKNFL